MPPDDDQPVELAEGRNIRLFKSDEDQVKGIAKLFGISIQEAIRRLVAIGVRVLQEENHSPERLFPKRSAADCARDAPKKRKAG